MQGRFAEYQRDGAYKPAVAMKWARRLVDRTAGPDKDRWTSRQRRQAARLLIQELAGTQDPTRSTDETRDRPAVGQAAPEAGRTSTPTSAKPDKTTEQARATGTTGSPSPAADQETESETPEPARHDGPERRHADLKSTLDRFRTRLKENLDGLNTTPPASGPDRNRGQRKTL